MHAKTSKEGRSSVVTEDFILSQFERIKDDQILSDVAEVYIKKCCETVQNALFEETGWITIKFGF